MPKMVEAPAADSTPPSDPSDDCPPFVTCGDHILRRVGGDFPGELVYLAQLAGFAVWLKSKELLAGPWDWIIMSAGNAVVDFEGPFATREEATESLSAFLGSLLPSTSAAPELLEVSAAPEPPAAVAGDVDREVLAHALDLAIISLRGARARITGAPAHLSR